MARIVFFKAGEPSPLSIEVGQNSISYLTKEDYSSSLLEHGSAFYVPTIIDVDSALSYNGVDLAIRIYLDCIQAGIFDIELFLLSAEDKGSFYSHCESADILKCPNVHFIRNSKSSIEASIISLDIRAFKKDTALVSLRSLKITAPSVYKTHHSITNEWCIYRWTKYLGIENVSSESGIEDRLYFKHLAVINGLNSVDGTDRLPIIPTNPNTPKPRFLLIDDDVDKGWHAFFERILSKSSVVFESLGGPSFRHKTSEEIEEIAISKVQSFDPDVVILDLRLEDADFDTEKTAKEYTGIRILKRIKQEINRGIQVIGFTASNKVWNYLEWSDSGRGIDDIVIKESPELSSNPSYTADSIIHLSSSLMTMIGRAQYLKCIDKSLKQIGSLIQSTDSSFYANEQHNISVAYELIKQYDVDPKYIAYAYLQLFQILEKYLKHITEWRGSDVFVLKHNGKEYRLLKYLSTNKDGKKHYESAISGQNGDFKLGKGEYDCSFVESNYIMSAVLIFLYGESKTPGYWANVRSVRNKKAAHPESNNVMTSEFLSLLKYLIRFFDPRSLKPRKESEALPQPAPSANALGNNPVLVNLMSSMTKKP